MDGGFKQTGLVQRHIDGEVLHPNEFIHQLGQVSERKFYSTGKGLFVILRFRTEFLKRRWEGTSSEKQKYYDEERSIQGTKRFYLCSLSGEQIETGSMHLIFVLQCCIIHATFWLVFMSVVL